MTSVAAGGRRLLVTTAIMTLLTVTAGCTSERTGTAASTASAGNGSVPPIARSLPSPHVHGVAVNPSDGRVYLATHHGLFRYDDSGPEQVGPVIDLMGFAVAGPDHFYASGHPGNGTDLPNPVGLIESIDGGRTWSPVSRQGQSDFHALTASTAGVLGYDGTLLAARDGITWEELPSPGGLAALAASPDGKTVLAVGAAGPVLRSTDGGRTWVDTAGGLPFAAVTWAGNGIAVGVTPDGVVSVSTDAGQSWQQRGTAAAPPQALAATGAGGEVPLRVLVVTPSGVLDSTDGGVTFADFRPGAIPG